LFVGAVGCRNTSSSSLGTNECRLFTETERRATDAHSRPGEESTRVLADTVFELRNEPADELVGGVDGALGRHVVLEHSLGQVRLRALPLDRVNANVAVRVRLADATKSTVTSSNNRETPKSELVQRRRRAPETNVGERVDGGVVADELADDVVETGADRRAHLREVVTRRRVDVLQLACSLYPTLQPATHQSSSAQRCAPSHPTESARRDAGIGA